MIEPINKNTVKAMLRRGEAFKGYIAPCNVSAFHVIGGWHIGMKVEFTSLQEMEDTVSNYASYNCIPELGMRVKFWRASK